MWSGCAANYLKSYPYSQFEFHHYTISLAVISYRFPTINLILWVKTQMSVRNSGELCHDLQEKQLKSFGRIILDP